MPWSPCMWLFTVYPKKYAHGFVVPCFAVVMQSFIMNSHEVFIHIHQGCFAGTGAIVRLPQCQWSKPDGYGKISQCKTTTKHSKAKTVCIFLGIYCTRQWMVLSQWSEILKYINCTTILKYNVRVGEETILDISPFVNSLVSRNMISPYGQMDIWSYQCTTTVQKIPYYFDRKKSALPF